MSPHEANSSHSTQSHQLKHSRATRYYIPTYYSEAHESTNIEEILQNPATYLLVITPVLSLVWILIEFNSAQECRSAVFRTSNKEALYCSARFGAPHRQVSVKRLAMSYQQPEDQTENGCTAELQVGVAMPNIDFEQSWGVTLRVAIAASWRYGPNNVNIIWVFRILHWSCYNSKV